MNWLLGLREPGDYDPPRIGLMVETGARIIVPQGTVLVHLEGCATHGIPHWLMEAFASQGTSPYTWGEDWEDFFSVYCIATAEQASVIARNAYGGEFLDGVAIGICEDEVVARRHMTLPPLPGAITDRLRAACRRACLGQWEAVSHKLREANYARRLREAGYAD